MIRIQTSLSCNVCPVGYKCVTTSSNPIACADGTYNSGGCNDCIDCPAGHRFVTATNNTTTSHIDFDIWAGAHHLMYFTEIY